MNTGWGNFYLGMSLLFVLLTGCGTPSETMSTRQADIGLGIVEGTKGYQQIQHGSVWQNGAWSKINGQVIRIEGAAYVVEMLNHRQVRLPFDENTKIDRPAHLGDWISASIDESGLTRFIQNIDDQIVLD